MSRRVGSAVAFGIALLAGLTTHAREGRACSPPPDGWYLYTLTVNAPQNGVVVVHYDCHSSCENEPDPESFVLRRDSVTTESPPVAGSVVMTGTSGQARFLVFRPEPGELELGQTYHAEFEGGTPLTGLGVAPETTWKSSFTASEEIFEIDYPRGSSVCCSGPLNSCGTTPCFRTEVDRRTAVTVTWDDDMTDESTQYAYRFLFDGDDADVPWSWNGPRAGFEFEDDASSVCYTLELQRLTDGFVHRLEERCIERPGDFDPGVHPTPEATIVDALASCDAPPSGYEASWCAGRAELCEASSEPWCDNWESICADDIDTGGAPGTGGSAGSTSGSGGSSGTSSGRGGNEARGGTAGTAGSTAGSGEAAAPGDGSAGEDGDDGSDDRVYTKGCGCALPGGGTSQRGALAFVALSLAALGLRRRGSN